MAEGVSKATGKVFGRGLNTMVLFSGALDSLEPFAEYGLPTDGSVDPAELLLDLYLEGFAVRGPARFRTHALLSTPSGSHSLSFVEW